MPRLRNNLSEIKEDLSYYFHELSHGIKTTHMHFSGVDELINFALLDIITALFNSKPSINQERFIANLESILSGIKIFHNKEKDNGEQD